MSIMIENGGEVQATEPVENQSAVTANAEAQTNAEDSDTSEVTDGDADSTDGDGEGSQAKAKKGGIQKRIDKLSKRAAEAKREADYWRAEAYRRQQSETPKKQDDEPRAQSLEAEPNADDFADHKAYLKAYVKWELAQEQKSTEQKKREEDLRSSEQKKVQEYFKKAETFKKTHDDFDEVIEEISDVQMSPAVTEIIVESDDGPLLMYELAKDPEEFKRICALPYGQAVRAIAKLEARLEKDAESADSKAEKKITQAPEPIRTIAAKSTGGAKKSLMEIANKGTYAEYEAARREQMKRKRA